MRLPRRSLCFASPSVSFRRCTAAASPFAAPVPDFSAAVESIVLRQYLGGKFRSLLSAAVADPLVLLSAARSLALRAQSTPPISHPAIDSISGDLRSGSLDIGAHCVRVLSSRKKGEALVLPDLRLKLVIEALRLVLDVVYNDRFATFAYGGRAGLGRHTGIRYLKSFAKNSTWWFRVVPERQLFASNHVSRLANVLQNKIDDPELLQLIEKLFELQAIQIYFGSSELGRGLPHENSLCSLLLNVYFDAVDGVIKEIRSEIHRQNPSLRHQSLLDNSKVFHKPVRVHAVRYLDEIMTVTSGKKSLILSIRERVLNVIEKDLVLKVDRLASSVHSAAYEKMDFMGFELQAVTPSVRDCPLSEKAMRARKKYLKMKAEKKQELKNARETVRKKLGMKILSHVLKKHKRAPFGFRFDFKIEREVKEIFGIWAVEVVKEFLHSGEEYRSWHHMLVAGDFLSLRRVRDQLPVELLDAYDKFEHNASKYLIPMRGSNFLQEEQRQEVEEEMEYAQRTVEDLTELHLRVNAPMVLVRRAVRLAGFTNSMGRPRPIKLLICLDDADIIKWYAGVSWRWLEFFCCCHNFKMVKRVVDYHLRFSCFLTLSEKHESSKREAIRHYTKYLRVVIENSVQEVNFPTEQEIRMMGDKNLSDPKPVDGVLCLILVRLVINEPSNACLAHFCGRTDTSMYRIRLLQNRLNLDPLNEKKWVPGLVAIHESLNKKCVVHCRKRFSDLLMGIISLQDIDCSSVMDLG